MMTNSSIYFDFTVTLVVCWLTACSNAFHTNVRPNQRAALLRPVSLGISSSSSDDNHHRQNPVVTLSRRSLFHKSLTSITTTATITSSSLLLFPLPALAKSLKDASLESLLYTLLRVREALTQETRLIQTGKFKDVQRANVKLAVRFMLKNYRLSDTLVAASAKLESPAQRLAAADVGNSIVETLYTILEYFDASNVENLKVGSFDNMAGKEELVVKGLEAARVNMDQFLAYFPKETVAQGLAKVEEENALNLKEFDPKLGDVFNLVPSAGRNKV